MKLTKKAAALLLAACLAVSVCATPVFATENMSSNITTETSPSNATKVLYKVTDGYRWSVPATIDFGVNAGANNTSTVEANLEQDSKNSVKGEPATKESGGTAWKGTAPKVMVTKNVIEPGKALKISLKAQDENAFKVKTSGTTVAELSYSVKTKAEKKDTHKTDTYSEIEVQPNGSLILELNAGVNTGEVDLEFVLSTTEASAEIAGTYEGHVVFTADATKDATAGA